MTPRSQAALLQLRKAAPKIHCLTNTVTMNDVANLLLAVGGSAIMAPDPAEAEEITSLCQGTLLNTGTPDAAKFSACLLAGKQAGRLGHPVTLDPVGAGASVFRRTHLQELLAEVHPQLIRCNLAEALTLLQLLEENGDFGIASMIPPDTANGSTLGQGGVESNIQADAHTRLLTAAALAKQSNSTVLLSGSCDAISDGQHHYLVHGGDARVTRLTGSGCMLSALCAAFVSSGLSGIDAALAASEVWKEASVDAGRRTDCQNAGMGSFHVCLLDAVSLMAQTADISDFSTGRTADSQTNRLTDRNADCTANHLSGNTADISGSVIHNMNSTTQKGGILIEAYVTNADTICRI